VRVAEMASVGNSLAKRQERGRGSREICRLVSSSEVIGQPMRSIAASCSHAEPMKRRQKEYLLVVRVVPGHPILRHISCITLL